MSRSAYAPRNEYIGTGNSKDYSFDFKIEALDQIRIILADADGNIGDDVDGNGGGNGFVSSVDFDPINGTGTVHFASNVPVDYRVIILLSNDEPTQPYEFKNRGDFTLSKLEKAFDWIAGPIQSLTYRIRRAVRLSELDDFEDFDCT